MTIGKCKGFLDRVDLKAYHGRQQIGCQLLQSHVQLLQGHRSGGYRRFFGP
jgi:hypothetical protein